MQHYQKGLKLYTFARDKAKKLGVFDRNANLNKLICTIQEKEGFSPCFRSRETCSESTCCWQASCGAEIITQ